MKQFASLYRAQLQWRPIAVLLIIAMIWGSNMAFVKLATRDIAPLFMAAIRSLAAAGCLCLWMKAKGLALFPFLPVRHHQWGAHPGRSHQSQFDCGVGYG